MKGTMMMHGIVFTFPIMCPVFTGEMYIPYYCLCRNGETKNVDGKETLKEWKLAYMHIHMHELFPIAEQRSFIRGREILNINLS